MSPPLKWAGGKRWLLPKLAKLWSKHSRVRLVEPFCGGLSVSLGLKPHAALLNDVNPALINFYQQIQKGLILDIELENDETLYYQHRELFNLLNMGNREQKKSAELFYYLNRTGYNGLCRFNKSGGYNVPFGRYNTINYKNNFLDYQKQLNKWVFSQKDFQELEILDNDFIYADPPYDVQFRQYSQQGFSWDDQERLAEYLSKHKGPVILSNQATGKVKKLYKSLGFKLHYLDAPRRISCKPNGRHEVKEVLALRGI